MNQCDVIERFRPQAACLCKAELPSRSGRAGLPSNFGDFDVVEGFPAFSVALRWRTLFVHHLQHGVGAGEELTVSVAFLDSTSFDARIRSGAFGSLRYCHLEADARDSRIACLARPDSGRQLVILRLSGTNRIAAGARMVRLWQNETLLVDQLDAIRVEDGGRGEQLLLILEGNDGAIENRLTDACLRLSRIDQYVGRSVATLHLDFRRPGKPSQACPGASGGRNEGELARAV